MNDILAVVKALKDPALVMAGIAIYLLYKLLMRSERARDSFASVVTTELGELNKTQAKLVTLLDLLCTKWMSGR